MIYLDENIETLNIPKTYSAGRSSRRDDSAVLPLDLPEEEMQYPNLAEMLADIGISEEQKAKMMEGGYVYVYDRARGFRFPFMVIGTDEVMFGYNSPDGADLFIVSFSLFHITHILL